MYAFSSYILLKYLILVYLYSLFSNLYLKLSVFQYYFKFYNFEYHFLNMIFDLLFKHIQISLSLIFISCFTFNIFKSFQQNQKFVSTSNSPYLLNFKNLSFFDYAFVTIFVLMCHFHIPT